MLLTSQIIETSALAGLIRNLIIAEHLGFREGEDVKFSGLDHLIQAITRETVNMDLPDGRTAYTRFSESQLHALREANEQMLQWLIATMSGSEKTI